MNINEAQELLSWCKANGVYKIELDNLKAEIVVDSPEIVPAKPTDENSFNQIPVFAPSMLGGYDTPTPNYEE